MVPDSSILVIHPQPTSSHANLKWAMRLGAVGFGLGGVLLLSKWVSSDPAWHGDPFALGGGVFILVLGGVAWYLAGLGSFGPPLTRMSLDPDALTFEFTKGTPLRMRWESSAFRVTLSETIIPQPAGGPPLRGEFIVQPPRGRAGAAVLLEEFDTLLERARSRGCSVKVSDLRMPQWQVRRVYTVRHVS